MKNHRTPGNDNLTAEILKAGGMAPAKWLHEMICDIWTKEVMVTDWTLATLTRIYKGRDHKQIYDNYRAISLLTMTSKLFLNHLEPNSTNSR